jgi:hypothetical protein
MPFALLLLLAPFPARAQATFEPNTAVWGAVTLRDVTEAPLNTGNLIAAEPQNSAEAELRPDWRLSGAMGKLTARPRLELTRDHVVTSASTTNRTLALLRWSEGFATWNATEALTFDYGLQNVQWGPAESASPSNRLFRDTVQAKDALYLVRGQHLLRATYAPSAAWSEVLLLEPTGNGEPEPEAGEPHARKAALKSEFSWAGGADFAGLVVGWRDNRGFWTGQYLNVEVFDGFYAYTDAEGETGSLAWYPVDGPVITFAQNQRNATNVNLFAVGGLRYAFENGDDVRVEMIHQSAGYSTAELGRTSAVFSSSSALQLAVLATQSNAARASGLDFSSRDYLFASARFPNAFNTRDWNLYTRALASLQDHSLSAFGSTENRLGERGTVIGALGTTAGANKTAELKGVVAFSATLAYRHAW